MALISVDVIGPLPRSQKQNKYALVLLDVATKFVAAIPMRSATSAAVVKPLLNDWILLHGPPEVLMSDNGAAFVGREMRELCNTYRIKQHFVPRYYPRGNPVERVNRCYKTAISIFANGNHRKWDEHLRHFSFALNTSVSESTSVTPAKLVFGRELRPSYTLHQAVTVAGVTEFDPAAYDDDLQREIALVYDKALNSVKKAKEQQASRYNLRHRSVTFKEGDMVWRKNFPQSRAIDGIASKLSAKFVGPFKITKVLSPTQFQLSTLGGADAGRWSSIHLKYVT